MGAVKVHFLMN